MFNFLVLQVKIMRLVVTKYGYLVQMENLIDWHLASQIGFIIEVQMLHIKLQPFVQ